jgi:radical SAM protein with 4Fe4S-binding SPASM domain
MDKYRVDSHKLMYHTGRLADWNAGKDIYPIYAEIAPAGTCNHRCIFCALDYLDYEPNFLDTVVLKKFITDISKKGVKSVMFAGEGEPLLHKDIAGIIRHTREAGIDSAVTTNGVLLKQRGIDDIIKHLSWLRISFNAGTPKTYGLVHRTHPEDFNKVVDNLTEAVRLKRKNGYPCTIGAQILLLAQNYNEAATLAGILKKVGLDYLIIKPYSQHPLSKNRLKGTINYQNLMKLEKKQDKFSDGRFRVIFRKHTMYKLAEERPYKKCLGLSFWAYLSAKGDLYACSAFLGDERFCYGNIYKDPFDRIWKGAKRKKILKMMQEKWDIRDCREVCRLDEINRYLWELKNPPAHVNFI